MKFPIFSKEGLEKCHANSVEYNGKWMGESYVTATILSPTPIRFEIGDYIEYLGQRFEINYDPSVTKSARALSVGDAFKYENVKFNSFVDELTRIRFLDVVDGDNGYHYSMLPKFSFFCATIKDFMLRIKANLKRCEHDWRVELTDNTESSTNISIEIDNKSVWESLEYISTSFKTSFVVKEKTDAETGEKYRAIVIGEELVIQHDMLRYGKGNGLKSIQETSNSQQQIITRLRAYGSTRNIPYRYYTGIQNGEGGNTYTYNPWYKYKAKIHDNDFGYRAYIKQKDGAQVGIIALEGPFSEVVQGYDTEIFIEGVEANTTRVVRVKYDKEIVDEVVSQGFKDFTGGYIELPYGEDYRVETYIIDALIYKFKPLVIKGGIPKKVLLQHKDIWYSPWPLAPSTMAINNLMLPDFLSYTVVDGELKDSAIHLPEDQEEFDAAIKVKLNPASCIPITNEKGEIIRFLYSDGKRYRAVYKKDELGIYQLLVNYDAYIEDKEGVERYGLREGCVFFDNDDPDNDISDIYPSLEGMKAKDVIDSGYVIKLPEGDNGFMDEILSGTDSNGIEPITDDGVPEDTSSADTEPEFFKIYIKDQGFNPAEYLSNEDMTIHMRSGKCGEREFPLKESATKNNPRKVFLVQEGKKYKISEVEVEGCVPAYELTCKRDYDDSLGLYFPNKDYPINGTLINEKRPEDTHEGVLHADRFVILNIELPRVYVDAASRKLETLAKEYLKRNSRTKKTYSLEIDPVYVAKDRISHEKEEDTLHYALREGNMLLFEDDDLRVENGVDVKLFIDSVTIKDGESPIPEYKITLREEKEFSTIQKIQNQITSVSNAAGKSLTASEAKAIAQSVAKGSFLSKASNDTADGVITFNKHQVLKDGFRTHGYIPGMNGGVGAGLTEVEGGTRFEVDYLSIRKRLETLELQIQKMSHIGGQQIMSSANAAIVDVLQYISEKDSNTYFRCYFDGLDSEGNEISNDWEIGDQARCQTFNLSSDSDNISRNHYWWRLVVDTDKDNEEGPLYIRNEEGTVVRKLLWFDVYGGNYDVSKCDIYSSFPKPGDNVVLFGHQGEDVSRQTAIVEAGAGTGSPYHRQYRGINRFEITDDMIPINLSPSFTKIAITGDGGEDVDVREAIGNVNNEIENINEQLDGKFDIYHIDNNAPTEEDVVKDVISVEEMGEYDISLLWPEEEYPEHVGDFALFADGICYKFVEDYYWKIVSDQYLISYVNDLRNTQKAVKDIEDDKMLTPLEKQQLLNMWNDELSVFNGIMGVDYTYYDYEDFVSAVGEYADVFIRAQELLLVEQAGSKRGILADLDRTTDLNTIRWSDYGFSSLSDLWKKLTSSRAYVESVISSVSKANGDKANERLKDIASDNVVTLQEKQELTRWWKKIVNDYDSIMHQWSSVFGIPEEGDKASELTDAYNALRVWMTRFLETEGDTDSALSDSEVSQYKESIDTYNNKYSAVDEAIVSGVIGRIDRIESEGIEEDIRQKLNTITEQYQDMQGTFTSFTSTYGAVFTQSTMGGVVMNKDVAVASGILTNDQYATMWSQMLDPDTGVPIAEALAMTYVAAEPDPDDPSVMRVKSGYKVSADDIDFNGKTLRFNAEEGLAIDSPHFKVDANGRIHATDAELRGFIYKFATEITPDNIEAYLLPASEWRREWVPELDFSKLGNYVVLKDSEDNTFYSWMTGHGYSTANGIQIYLPCIRPYKPVGVTQIPENYTEKEIELRRSLVGQFFSIENSIIETGVKLHVIADRNQYDKSTGKYDYLQDRGMLTNGGSILQNGKCVVCRCDRAKITDDSWPRAYYMNKEIIFWDNDEHLQDIIIHDPR